MVMLVTLEQASERIRRDTNADDADLTLMIHSASHAVINYLNGESPYVKVIGTDGLPALDSNGGFIYDVDSSGDPIPLEVVQQAVLYLIGVFYDDRDGKNLSEWQPGFLPAPVTALLYPLRTPAIA